MNSDNKKNSIVIIGAGTVGLMLAHELILKGEPIIILEAGNESSIDFFDNTEFKNIGLNHAGVKYGRAKGIGGTTNLWGGQFTEFIQNDIENSHCYNQPKWPITWNEINNYYSRVYQKMGFTSSIPVPSKTIAKHDSNKTYLEIFYSRWLKQPNFKFHYLEALKKSELVTFYTNVVVTNLHFNNKKCTSVQYITNEQTKTIENCKEVVLALGTIEIIRLLLHSATNVNCPYTTNQNIGKYFQDHLNFKVGEIQKASKPFLNQFSNFFENGEKLQPKLRMNADLDATNNYVGICGFFSYESKVSEHLYNFKQFAKSLRGQSKQKLTLKELGKLFVKLVPALPQISMLIFNYFKNNRIYVPFNSKVKVIINTQQISIFESNVSISKTDFDNKKLPKVVVDWQIDGKEFDKIVEFCTLLQKYLKENNSGNLVLDDWFVKGQQENNKNWLSQISDVYHQAGGAIMSNSIENGVVDENLKVHNTVNLYVCGSSVMPTSSYGNITLTALALTLRLSDYLTKK